MTQNIQTSGILEWILVSVGAVPMAIESYFPTAIRRNFGARIFLLAWYRS